MQIDQAVCFSHIKQASVNLSSLKATIEYSSPITCMEFLVHIGTDRKPIKSNNSTFFQKLATAPSCRLPCSLQTRRTFNMYIPMVHPSNEYNRLHKCSLRVSRLPGNSNSTLYIENIIPVMLCFLTHPALASLKINIHLIFGSLSAIILLARALQLASIVSSSSCSTPGNK